MASRRRPAGRRTDLPSCGGPMTSTRPSWATVLALAPPRRVHVPPEILPPPRPPASGSRGENLRRSSLLGLGCRRCKLPLGRLIPHAQALSVVLSSSARDDVDRAWPAKGSEAALAFYGHLPSAGQRPFH